jgi:hypothetical protein
VTDGGWCLRSGVLGVAGGCSFLPIKVFEVQQHVEGPNMVIKDRPLSSISKNNEPSYLSIVETEENKQNEDFWVQLANVRSCRSTCLKSNNTLKGLADLRSPRSATLDQQERPTFVPFDRQD